ncbi:MAG TPA: aspartate aminotransferase family protein, partial [Desulfobacteraceae bacterium]|nr:aspartate aminotransferase family protein [Desulfobacteraceae bacterium]
MPMKKIFYNDIIDEYKSCTPLSSTYSEQARKYLPGGATRTLSFFQPYPPYIDKGHGSKIIDVDGNERIDFFNNATSLILGHAYPSVVKAVTDQVIKGTAFHAPTLLEVDLAKILCERIPSVQKIRFANSGTEAVMFALMAAKVYTGKSKIGKFEGGYHGSCEHMCVSIHPDLKLAGSDEFPCAVPESSAISENILSEVVVMPYNNIDAVEKIIKKEKDDLACIIVEPMLGAGGIIPARKGFLNDLWQITKDNEILLIFDEVQTFRNSSGGAQKLCGVTPDLTALGKIIGGGFPVGAIGGKKEIMDVFDSSAGKAKLPHGGTFNGNPITMAAGIATLQELSSREYEKLEFLGDILRSNLTQLIEKYNFKACVTGELSFFRIHFTRDEIWDYRTAIKGVN